MQTGKLTRFDGNRAVPRWSSALAPFFPDLWENAEQESETLLSPRIDVGENETNITVTAELPGLERKDIDLQVKDGVLVLRGEKRMEEESRDRNYHRIERRYGSFYRALSLPDVVDPGAVTATFNNGVLKVVLAKREDTKPRSITIGE